MQPSLAALCFFIVPTLACGGRNREPVTPLAHESTSPAMSAPAAESDGVTPRAIAELWFRHQGQPARQRAPLSEQRRTERLAAGTANVMTLVSLDDEHDPAHAESYLRYGRGYGRGLAADELRVFRAVFDVRWVGEPAPSLPDGRHVWRFIVIRETPRGPWVLDGEGPL